MSLTKFAILDIDNTLYDWTLWIEWLKILIREWYFEPSAWEEIMKIFKAYRNSEISREKIFDLIYPIYWSGIKWLSKEVIYDVANRGYSRSSLYSSTKILIQYLRDKWYYIVALSWSSEEIVKIFSEDLWIDKSFWAKFESINGIYTWRLIEAPSIAQNKKSILLDYIQEFWFNIDRQLSVAIWDSESESLLFDMVWIPIVFEPHPSFRPIAEKHSNRHIVDRDSIIEKVQKLVK